LWRRWRDPDFFPHVCFSYSHMHLERGSTCDPFV
jgi:hypothetical protein